MFKSSESYSSERSAVGWSLVGSLHGILLVITAMQTNIPTNAKSRDEAVEGGASQAITSNPATEKKYVTSAQTAYILWKVDICDQREVLWPRAEMLVLASEVVASLFFFARTAWNSSALVTSSTIAAASVITLVRVVMRLSRPNENSNQILDLII
jgi:hypothetical protein